MSLHARSADPSLDAARYQVALEQQPAPKHPCSNCGRESRQAYRTPIKGEGISYQCSSRCWSAVWRAERSWRMRNAATKIIVRAAIAQENADAA